MLMKRIEQHLDIDLQMNWVGLLMSQRERSSAKHEWGERLFYECWNPCLQESI
jgi:hypothetical protein